MPTETVYGLAADATSRRGGRGDLRGERPPRVQSADRACISASKRRGSLRGSTPTPSGWRAPSGRGRSPWCCRSPPTCRVSLLARAGLDSLALRAPDHPVARALIEAAGGRSPRPRPTARVTSARRRPDHVLADLDGRIDWILDAGPSRHGVESTIVACLEARADAAASGRRRSGGDRGGARASARDACRPARRAERAGTARLALRAARAAAARRRSRPDRTRRRSISAACSPARRRGRVSIFRRPATWSRRRRTCSPTCGRSTPPARPRSPPRRSPRAASARRSTTGCGAPRRPETAECRAEAGRLR